jgi:hypothetical protein
VDINPNLQVVSNFKMVVSDSDFDYFVQSAELPSVSLSPIDVPWKIHNTRVPDNQTQYDLLNISFLLSEDMKNYVFLLDWLKKCSNTGRLNHTLKDVTLHILTNNKTTNREIKFIGSFPTSIGSVNFDSGSSDASGIVVSCTIAYQYFEIS